MATVIDFPFRFSANGDIHTASDSKLIETKIKQLILTKGRAESFIGELPWNTNFGSGIYLVRHSNAKLEDIKAEIGYFLQKSLKKYMSEIEKFKYQIQEKQISGNKALYITIIYLIGQEQNKVDLTIIKE
jgi:hypothetical protein